MKGPFSIWTIFGLTLWIDLITHIIFLKKEARIDPYNPIRQVSVIIPITKEPEEKIEQTVVNAYSESYPLKSVILCGDSKSDVRELVKKMNARYENFVYIDSPYKSKARKINFIVRNFKEILGEFIYVRDCGLKAEGNCTEKMLSYFNEKDVAAVTSYGRVSIPKNFLSRSYYYGKSWINEIGRFRKNAQEKRKAVFVICGASTMFKTEILQRYPIPSISKTEDTHYTWLLQRKGFKIRVADDAIASALEMDGVGIEGIKKQIKQSYRWSSGTIQCLYREGKGIFENKRLAYTTIIPGFLESVTYSIPLLLLPFLFFLIPNYAIGFLIGDTVFSLVGTLFIIPKKFFKTFIHYPQIIFFKYLNSAVFIAAVFMVTFQAIAGKTEAWSNEWISPLSVEDFE